MSWLKAYTVAIVSLLSGAAVVHNIYKPDLVRLGQALELLPALIVCPAARRFQCIEETYNSKLC